MFVDTTKVAVTDGDNTIYVKRKMDFGTKNLVRDEIFRISMRNGQPDSVVVSQGAYDLALMLHNVVDWDGPAFQNGHGKVPCTPENVKRLDPDEPIVGAVLAKINDLNAKGETVAPLPATTPTAPGSPASTPKASKTTHRTSTSP